MPGIGKSGIARIKGSGYASAFASPEREPRDAHESLVHRMKTKVGAKSLRRSGPAICHRDSDAIVITVLCFALGRCQPAERTLAEVTPRTTVVLERAAPTPPPTPRPTPPPTQPPVPRVTLAPIPQRAAPRAVRASGGGHAAPPPHLQVVTPSVIVAGSGGGAGPAPVAARARATPAERATARAERAAAKSTSTRRAEAST